MPEFIKKIPIPVLLALLGPPLIIGGIVQVMMVNLGAGNQHLSSNADGFHEWLLWPLVGLGLLIGLGIGGFVYFGLGRGADEWDEEDEDEDDHKGETGLLEV